MATAESAPSSTGPQYAPDDPTLPKPWKGLINGSVLYYWNPETNATQYEKPAAPLPLGPPPATTPTTPKLASIPVAQQVQQNGMIGQEGPQIMQTTQQQGQQISQFPQQQGPPAALVAQQQHSQMAQTVQQQVSLVGQSLIQQGQLAPQQMLQHPGQQTPHQFSQHLPHQLGQQVPLQQGQEMPHHAIQPVPQQLGQQTPQHPGQQTPQQQGSQIAHLQGHQYMHPQLQFFTYQQTMHPQRPQGMQQQSQHIAHAQPFLPQQEYRGGFLQREEVDLQQGNQIGISPPQFQQSGNSSVQSMPAGMNSIQSQMGAQSGQLQQLNSTVINSQQPTSSAQMHQRGSELIREQHGPMFPNRISPTTTQNQRPNLPPAGLKMGYEDNLHERVGHDFYVNPNKEGPIIAPQQPKLAAIPMARNQQDMRIGIPLQDVTSGHAGGGLNAVAGLNMPNLFNHATDGPAYSNNSLTRQSSTAFGSSDVTNPSPAEVYRQQHEVTATGDNVPAPFTTFEATGFPPEILREIHLAGFSSPTPIQAQTWPIALQNRDIVAIAKTGSGKTLGYLIPAFIHLRRRRNNPLQGPTVLVLAPTRELATQIQDEVIKFGRSSRVSCTCLYGGAPKGPQLKDLDRGADIVVATPGRLNDILEMKKIEFGQVSFLVLDEADRMLDMGFEPQIRKIVNEIPPHRQTLMYTATWPKEVRKIANDLLANPVQVNIGSVDELAANKAITQYVEVVPLMERQRRVEQILRSQERGSKVIIFCSTKRLCDQLARSIGRNFGAAVIHGDKSQGERDWVLSQFRSGKSPILVATDVAARGLDIKDIRIVINYDFPTGIEDYVHRIGRTGRAGATGVSYTFFSDQDWKHAADLIKVLEGASQYVPPEVREMAVRGGPTFGKDRGGMNRFDGGGGGRWDSGGRGGMRDGGFSVRGGMRDVGFSGRGGMRDSGFSGRGGTRDGNFGGHAGFRGSGFGGRGGARDGAFSGGRNDFFPGRGNRGRGFGGPGSAHVGWGRNDRGPHDRYSTMEGRGRGRGRDHDRDRFDNRRDYASRSRGRSYSSSPERVRTWGYSRSRSRSKSGSRSWSRSRSCSRSPSRSRSHSRGRSPRCSRGRGYSRGGSRSRSRSYDRHERFHERDLDEKNVTMPAFEAPPGDNALVGAELVVQPSVVDIAELGHPEALANPSHQSLAEP